jgi:hypothetical protein
MSSFLSVLFVRQLVLAANEQQHQVDTCASAKWRTTASYQGLGAVASGEGRACSFD